MIATAVMALLVAIGAGAQVMAYLMDTGFSDAPVGLAGILVGAAVFAGIYYWRQAYRAPGLGVELR
jgi:hypothetical protein